MPNNWISRVIEPILQEPAPQLRLFPVWLLLGPRQVGKSATLKRCAEGNRQIVDLDDLATRMRAQTDPVLFAKDLRLPLLIDEIQYAPMLLSAVKLMVDRGVPPGSVWLTGSQNFSVMQGVQESLAGRVAILHLLGLSDIEKHVSAAPPTSYFASIVESSFPKLYGVAEIEARNLYLSSYTQTYIERDIRELMGIHKRRSFEIFLKMCALRTGQIVSYEDIARDVGVSAATVRDWIGVLEDSFLIRLVHPYHANHNKRLIKRPKLYFLDMGLAAFLAGWRDSEMLYFGPMAGAAFETHVFANMVRYFSHHAREYQVHFWRTRDQVEIDFLVETQNRCFPIEVKMGMPSPQQLPKLAPISEKHWQMGTVISLAAAEKGTTQSLTPEWQLSGPLEFPF